MKNNKNKMLYFVNELSHFACRNKEIYSSIRILRNALHNEIEELEKYLISDMLEILLEEMEENKNFLDRVLEKLEENL